MITRPSPYDPFEAQTWQGFFRDVHAFLTLTTTSTLNFGSILASAVAELTVTLRGADINDCVVLGPPSTIESDLTWSAFVSAVDTVKIRLHNNGVIAIDPASAIWRVTVLKY